RGRHAACHDRDPGRAGRPALRSARPVRASAGRAGRDTGRSAAVRVRRPRRGRRAARRGRVLLPGPDGRRGDPRALHDPALSRPRLRKCPAPPSTSPAVAVRHDSLTPGSAPGGAAPVAPAHPIARHRDTMAPFVPRARDMSRSRLPTAGALAALLTLAAPAFAADEIHFTIMGQTAMTFDWRGAENTIRYGLTTA